MSARVGANIADTLVQCMLVLGADDNVTVVAVMVS